MKIKKNIAVSETGFVFDPNSGESFNLNSTGQFILKMLATDKSEDEIKQAVLEKYKIEALQLDRYIDDFKIMLLQFGIIEKEED